MLIDGQSSCLVLVDIQENLCPVTEDPRRVIYNAARLARGAAMVSVPVLASEQYPKGLGPTMFDVREHVPDDAIIAKTAFSCAREEAFMARLGSLGRRQVVLAGVEAHVCVLQTALDLKAKGFEVAVVEEGCSSRRSDDFRLAMQRLAHNGCDIVTPEMVLFEWLGNSTHPAFKDVQRQLVK